MSLLPPVNTNVIKRKRHPLPKLFVGIVIFLLVLQVVVSNRLSTAGIELNRIENDVRNLTQENEILEERIASASALLTLKEKAFEPGFTRQVSPVFLAHDLPVALDLR